MNELASSDGVIRSLNESQVLCGGGEGVQTVTDLPLSAYSCCGRLVVHVERCG